MMMPSETQQKQEQLEKEIIEKADIMAGAATNIKGSQNYESFIKARDEFKIFVSNLFRNFYTKG
jgi:hypothetical protein